MSTWADAKVGDRVELRGKAYTVAKIKAKGKRAKVTVEAGVGAFTAEVKLREKVEILALAERGGRGKSDALLDSAGRMTRWASAGDPEVIEPPAPLSGRRWDETRGQVEARLVKAGAVLIAETPDESAGYFVPPVTVDTIAAHLVLFHEARDLAQYGVDDMLELHDNQHAEAISGARDLPVNHWHTETRPKAAK